MYHHFLFLSVLLFTASVDCSPTKLNYQLKNICPKDIFTYNKTLVNSYYTFVYKFKIEFDLDIEYNKHTDFKYFPGEVADKLNVLKEIYNEYDLKDLEDFHLKIKTFLVRNINITYDRMYGVKKELEQLQTKLEKGSIGEKQLKTYVDRVEKAMKIIDRIPSFASEYAPAELDLQIEKFKNKLNEELQINEDSEALVFSVDELINQIHQLGIFKLEEIFFDGFRTNFYIPFDNKYYESYQCVSGDKLPVFYRSK